MKQKIVEELDKIGFKRYYKGYKYLTEVIYSIYENNMIYDFNLKKVYSQIAKKHKVKIGAVKGNINYLINVTVLNEYSKKRMLDYGKFDEKTNMSAKKLVQAVIYKLFF